MPVFRYWIINFIIYPLWKNKDMSNIDEDISFNGRNSFWFNTDRIAKAVFDIKKSLSRSIIYFGIFPHTQECKLNADKNATKTFTNAWHIWYCKKRIFVVMLITKRKSALMWLAFLVHLRLSFSSINIRHIFFNDMSNLIHFGFLQIFWKMS